jgi:hypothetical protein
LAVLCPTDGSGLPRLQGMEEEDNSWMQHVDAETLALMNM